MGRVAAPASAGRPASTRVIRLLLAYDGTGFRGWARQRDPSIRTVQGELVLHLERVLRERPTLTVAGRTDAGVHARGQVVSFTSGTHLSADRLRSALNAALAPEVVVREVTFAHPGFDARFAATAREYAYRIDLAEVPDPFTARFVWHRPGWLSVPRMRLAAQPLVGEHDFTSFCRHPGPERSTVRSLERVTVARRGDRLVVRLRANAFLHQMVRSIVGALVAVGDGRLDPSDVARILRARDRSGATQLAPARGLTLERVVYGRRDGTWPGGLTSGRTSIATQQQPGGQHSPS
jgi:tRNA pseudouridine38-40 synthase